MSQRSVSVHRHTPAVRIAGTGITCFNVCNSQTVLPRIACERHDVPCSNSPGSLDGPMSLSGTTQKLSSTAERSRDVRMSSNGQNRPSTLGPDHLRADKQASGGADLGLQKDGKPGKAAVTLQSTNHDTSSSAFLASITNPIQQDANLIRLKPWECEM